MHPSRPRPLQLILLSFLLGTTSLFAWLWLVVFPASLFLPDPLAALCRPPVLMMTPSHLALLGELATGGLWYCQAWAFRLGLALSVCALALDLLWLALSLSWDLFELGPVLLLVLIGVILLLFLKPAVARAMIIKRHP